MNDQIELIKLVTGLLEKTGIPYMLTGSSALGFYAQPRMTRDVDLVVELKPSDSKTLISLFTPAFYLDENAVRRAIQDRTMFNAIHNASLVKVDFIVRKDDRYRKVEFDRRQQMKLIDGARIMVASPEDLILSKLVWSKDSDSEIQKRDIRSLLDMDHKPDDNYLKKWAAELGVSQKLQELNP